MTQSIDLRPQDLKIVREIINAALPPEVRVHVFGSRVTGKARKASDLDLTIDAGRVLTQRELAGLADAFDQSDLFCSVDLVDFNNVSAAFRQIIEGQMVMLERD